MSAPRSKPYESRLIAVIVFLGAPAPPSVPAEVPATNRKVVEFARAHLGRRVGNGECIALAREALESAGAKSFPLSEPSGDYAWGRLVASPKDVLPGDVLQFRDAEFKGKRWVTKRHWISWHVSYPHHTALVSSVSEGGNLLTILHQNVGGPGVDEEHQWTVQEGTLRMDSLQPGGWVRIYRPIDRSQR